MAKATPRRTSGSKPKAGSMRILAIDGGGMLGLTTAMYLKELESRLKRPLHESFDLIAGTSTGSILAVAVGAGLSIDRIIKLYLQRGREIFPSGASGLIDSVGRMFSQGVSRPKHSDHGLETALREELISAGKPIKFGSMKTSVMITAYDTIERRAWVFKSWRSWLQNVDAWELVKGSCSAPTFFPAHVMSMSVPISGGAPGEMEYRQFSLIDGGVWANNPAAVGLAEAHQLRRDAHEAKKAVFDPDQIVVASFGNIDRAAEAISARSAREWGPVEWVKKGDIISVMMDGSQETAGYITMSMVPEGRFHRFSLSVRGAEEYDMDDASEQCLRQLQARATEYLRLPVVQKELDKLAEQLRPQS